MAFKIKYKDKKTKARFGILKTKKGFLETPLFLPVATKTAVKFIDSLRLKELNVKAVISNSFILSLSDLISLIEKMKGIGNFMNFDGVNFTDSGGFQMYSQALYEKSNDKGVLFKNPVNGRKIFMTPEENMKLQLRLSSEIAMCLDSMPLYENSKKEIKEAVIKTVLWARKCKETHDKLQKNKNGYNKNKIRIKKQLLFGITQGGIYQDLRKYCIKELLKLNFDGYAIGGFGLGEKRKDEFKIIELHKKLIPENKPLYLMGIGDPIEILEAIKLGCDIFDSRMPTQNARHGTLFTSQGKLRIFNKKYESDKKPIDKRCKCFVCKNYSRAYIRFLLKEEEPVGKELASYHNLYYLQNLIEKSRIAIKKNKFFEFVKKTKRLYKN